MSTNSISNANNDRTSNGQFAGASRAAQPFGQCRTLLWLALPLALAAGCATSPNRAEVTEDFPDFTAPTTAPVSERRTENVIVGNEIYEMLLANRDIGNYLMATADNGVVVLSGSVTTRAERREIDERIRDLTGVSQVKDDLYYGTMPVVPPGLTLENRRWP